MLLASLIIPLVTAAPSLPYLLPNRLKMQESTPQSDFHVDTIQRVSGRPVKVSLGVMSHCPDAVLCEAVWDKTIDLVGGMMDLNLLFIGSLDSSAKYGVACKHGESECRANIVELCVAKYWNTPSLDEDKSQIPWIDSWNCMNYGPLSKIGDDSTAESCAACIGRKYGEDKALQSCINGREGIKLLKKSIKKSAKFEVTKSCTILIEDKQTCIHDGEWKDCPGGHEPIDFANQVKEEWSKWNDEPREG